MSPWRLPWRASNALGPLETQVMQLVWDRSGEASVRDVHQGLEGGLAYTTVMTTLDRLFKKGLLARRREGRSFLYWARLSRADLSRDVAGALVEALLGREPVPHPILSGIVDAVSDKDRAMLDELERLVRLKRRELQERDR
jgi:predicted transcriptional regulator